MQTLLSDYIGKQVIKANGEYAGYVTGVELSKKLDVVRALVCADSDEDEFIIPPTTIKAFGDGGIIVKSLGGKLAKERVPAPVGMRVLSLDGDLLGVISDFELIDTKISAVILGGGERHPLYKIKGLGECAILDLNGEPPKPKTASAKKSEPLCEDKQLSIQVEQPEIQVTAGSNLLTGKTVPRDIFDVRGNLIIKKGSVITPETLKSAIFHNKLFELTITVLNA